MFAGAGRGREQAPMVMEAVAESEIADAGLPDMPEPPDEESDGLGADLEPDDAEYDDGEDVADETDDQESDAGTEEQPQRQRTTDEWADVLYNGNGRQIANVPAKDRDEVLAKFGARHAEAARSQTEMLAAQQRENAMQWVRWTLSVRDRYADDPDAEREFILGNSPEAQAYVRWLDAITPKEETPEARAASESRRTLNDAMAEQVHLLAESPALAQELAQKHAQQPYELSAAGLRRLTRDVAELVRKGERERIAREQAPGRRRTQARQVAADQRRDLPRPTGGGSRPAGKAPSSLSEYESKLATDGLSESEWSQYERLRHQAGFR